MTWRAGPEPLVVRATCYSHQLNPLFTPHIDPLLRRLGTATLAMGEDVRVGPWLLESEGSGSTFLGHYHSGIYRDSRVNRHTNDTFSSIAGPSIESRQAHLARDRGRTANSCGSEITSTRPHNDFVPSDPPAPAELLMMRRTPRQLPATLRQPSGSSTRLYRQKLPLGQYHRVCVRTERAASELDRSK